jgi:hypothetical protein
MTAGLACGFSGFGSALIRPPLFDGFFSVGLSPQTPPSS